MPKYIPFPEESSSEFGSLDKANAEKIMSILKELNENEHKTVIMVTHDEELKKQGKTLIEL